MAESAKPAPVFTSVDPAIRFPDPERAIHSIFRISYAAIARYLGFGAATTAAWEGDWKVLKEDVAAMSASFLLHPPRA